MSNILQQHDHALFAVLCTFSNLN